MKQQLIQSIRQHKLIAILRGIPSQKLLDTAQALYLGGIRLLEVTYSADGRVSDADTAKQIELLATHFGSDMHIGAGTVLTPEQVRLTQAAGGRFIISPDVNPAVIAETNRCALVSIPGALTPSEITLAHRAGADFVKLFPANGLGPAYVRAITAPLSHIPLLAVGGIDETNMADYLHCGICGFGISSNLTRKAWIDSGDFEAITALAKHFVAVIEHG